MVHKGSCHCGQIAFEVEGEIGPVIDCNCSMCQRKGALLWFVERSALKLLQGESRTYTFNKHAIRHHFCPNCGIHPLAEARDPQGREMAAINVRCLDDIDLAALTIKPF